MYDLKSAAEEISNDPKLPASMTVWANEMFVKLQNENALVRVKDFIALIAVAEDRDIYGLSGIEEWEKLLNVKEKPCTI